MIAFTVVHPGDEVIDPVSLGPGIRSKEEEDEDADDMLRVLDGSNDKQEQRPTKPKKKSKVPVRSEIMSQ
jgi:hypothetical protein